MAIYIIIKTFHYLYLKTQCHCTELPVRSSHISDVFEDIWGRILSLTVGGPLLLIYWITITSEDILNTDCLKVHVAMYFVGWVFYPWTK